MSRLRVSLLMALAVGMLTCLVAGAEEAAAVKADAKATTLIPVPRPDQWWVDRQKQVNDRVKQGGVDMIFIGDSITHAWETAGKATWDKLYAKRNAVNMGFSGDRTEHVLWRLDNGSIDGISPKLAVIMIGTNNSGANTAEEIGAGIQAIVAKLREKLPEMKILILAIFPREAKPSATRDKLAAASKIASESADDKMVFFQDIGADFLEADGALPETIMPDFLHPNEKGYEIWANAIEDDVAKLMGEKE